MRVAMVTNIPAPYRLPVYERLAAQPGVELCVFFFSGREPDRKWALPAGKFKQVFLQENFFSVRGRFIHFNPDLWKQLRLMRPDVVITTGFNPSHLIAFVYAVIHRIRHIPMTDGTRDSESTLSLLHRAVRCLVYRCSSAFIGASDGAVALYKSYGVAANRIFKSHLCANNAAFVDAWRSEKRFDFIFCGRFVAIKNPFFAIDVACLVAKRLGRKVSILFVGDGELRTEIRAATDAVSDVVAAEFAGFATQEQLPGHYGAARIFLFPTQWDPWGVVANEACAAGLPVLVSPVAGSAGELVIDGQNGYVLPLDLGRWAGAATRLLSDPVLYAAMSLRGRQRVAEYNFDNAAAGIVDALDASRTRRPKVVILQRRMTNYRIPLFDRMRALLDAAGIDLVVVFGNPTPDEKQKNDTALLRWGTYVPCRYWFNGRICWQNAAGVVKDADLIIVTQENKLLFNYVLGISPGKKMAFWGHGKNFQANNPHSSSERMKRWLMTRASWWFAYTDISADVIVNEAHFPRERVTVLNNSFDTKRLADDLSHVTNADVQHARRRYGIGDGPIGIMLASLHADKRIDFLINAAQRIRARFPDFELLIVGDGPDRSIVQAAVAQAGGWIHWLGSRDGFDKAVLLRMATVMLNPGMVGLGILDSHVAGLPMVTCTTSRHSPEIAYLENGVNGLLVRGDEQDYANAVATLLTDAQLYAKLKSGCIASAKNVSLENMSARFCGGIARCLGLNADFPLAKDSA